MATPFKSINPATEEVFASFNGPTDAELEKKLQGTAEAFQLWKKTSMKERSALMKKAAADLKENKESYATTITMEMGKPIAQSIAEVEKCALLCNYYAVNAEEQLKNSPYGTEFSESYVSYEPIGIVYAIMPWNFPFWQVFRCAVPAIMAGNAVILKHAQNVFGCARQIDEVFNKAGFPEYVFTNLFIDHEQSDKVIAFPGVQGISLTGSDRAGSHVASQAGKVIKRTVLELGGSDPFIILEDADLNKAVETAVKSRMQNAGQSCIAAKRFIVHKNVAKAFTDKFVQAVDKLKVGDPMDTGMDMGPMARADLRDTLIKQVEKTLSMGAKVLTGGKAMPGKGYYYQPTIITDIPKDSPAYKEELFGPVASVFVVDTEEEAIQLANDTEFGLGASLWTQNRDKARALAARIESGNVFVNAMVKSDPRIPFGGIKKSGYGRELSDVGIHEFVNIKTVCIA